MPKIIHGIRVTITGPIASGKSTVAAVISRALREAGFGFRLEDEGVMVSAQLQKTGGALKQINVDILVTTNDATVDAHTRGVRS